MTLRLDNELSACAARCAGSVNQGENLTCGLVQSNIYVYIIIYCFVRYPLRNGHSVVFVNEIEIKQLKFLHDTDILKTFGALPEWRTSKHVENSGFTSPPKVLQDLIFVKHYIHHWRRGVQAGKLKFFGTSPNWVVSYIAYIYWYKIPLAQACFPLARPNFHVHWRALVSQPTRFFLPIVGPWQ